VGAHRSAHRARASALIDVICGWDAALAHWVGHQLDIDLGPGCVAVGFAEDGELLGAIVYNRFDWPNIEATIWASSPRWCNRRTLFACFYHPFLVLKCRRLGAVTAVTNTHAQDFLERLGFVREGLAREAMREAAAPGGYCDAVCYGMLASECRWLGRLRPPPGAAPAH